MKYCPNDQYGNRRKVGICSKSSTSPDMLTKYAWDDKNQCGQCKFAWYLCQLCFQQSIQMETNTKLYNHNYLYHGENFHIKDFYFNTSNISSKKKKRKVDVETLSKNCNEIICSRKEIIRWRENLCLKNQNMMMLPVLWNYYPQLVNCLQ